MGNRFEKHVPVMQLDEITSAEENILAELAAIVFATGDLIYYDGADLVRLPIGSAGQFLKVSGGIPTWSAEAGLGDVTGPASATDGAVVLFDGATGKIIKNSSTTISGTTLTGIDTFGTALTGLTFASAAIISFNAGDVTITHSANALAFAGASSGYSFSAAVLPATDDGAALGSATFRWSDLFLAEGAVIGWDGTDVTITQTNNVLTFAGATDRYEFDGPLAPTANDGETLGTAALGWADLYFATGANVLVNNANAKRTIILSGGGGQPTTTIGCGGPTRVEAGTNDVDYFALEFDTTTEERSFWNVQMPDNYDGGTVTAQFVWTNAGGGAAETVVWGIKALSLNNDEAIDQAYGAEITVSDTWIAQGDVHISDESSAITLAGTPAAGEYVIFNVGRKTGSDTLTGDARLLAVRIKYGINAYSD